MLRTPGERMDKGDVGENLDGSNDTIIVRTKKRTPAFGQGLVSPVKQSPYASSPDVPKSRPSRADGPQDSAGFVIFKND